MSCKISDIDLNKAMDNAISNLTPRFINKSENTNVSDNKLDSTQPSIIVYDLISEGNGVPYKVASNEITMSQKTCMKFAPVRQLIQLFIELRNSLGFKSHPPHNFNMTELIEAINLFQEEYSKKYGLKFCYGFNIIKADHINIKNNVTKPHDLIKQRKYELELDDEANTQTTNETDNNVDYYYPAIEEEHKYVSTLENDRLNAILDAKEITTPSRIFGNREVIRRKNRGKKKYSDLGIFAH